MYKGIKLNDISKMLDLKHRKFLEILKQEGVILNTNGRNLPIQLFISRGWFIVDQIKFTSGRHEFQVPTVYVTNKGLNEIKRIIFKNSFNEYQSINIFKDIFMYVSDFLKNEKSKETIVIDNEDIQSIFLSTKKKTELILKYNKKENIIWLPK